MCNNHTKVLTERKCDAAVFFFYVYISFILDLLLLLLFCNTGYFGGHVYEVTLFEIQLEGQKQKTTSKVYWRWALDKLQPLRRCCHF